MNTPTLSKFDLQSIVLNSIDTWRPLERARYSYHFISPDPRPVLQALAQYQNPDGGYGHGLEPDMWSPQSSPLATSVALQILTELDEAPGHMFAQDELVATTDKALKYLATTYNPKRMGWTAAGTHINAAPHAPWWHANSKGETAIDRAWGNPTAELLGYFAKWQPDHGESGFHAQLDKLLINIASQGANNHFDDEHEIYCYIRAYPHLSKSRQGALKPHITRAVAQLVKDDPASLEAYGPKPLDFVGHPSHETFGITHNQLQIHLDYLVDQLLTRGRLTPTWQWGQYPEAWETAKAQWTGIITLNGLIALNNFSRIHIGG